MIADGKLVANLLKERIVKEYEGKAKKEVCFIIFGENLASQQFIDMKCRFAESLKIPTRVVRYPESLTLEEVKNVISKVASEDPAGVVVQLPLPKHLPVSEVLNTVPPKLDIDVLGDKTKEKYRNGTSHKVPPVARAIMEIFTFYDVVLQGKEILVIGTGRLVGEPVCNMLESLGIKYSVIDKDTDLNVGKKLISEADIIISGAGASRIIKPDMVKEGVVLIDAGTSEQNGKIVGDIDPSCADKASLMTPVPGGVGPVTLASLFLNLD